MYKTVSDYSRSFYFTIYFISILHRYRWVIPHSMLLRLVFVNAVQFRFFTAFIKYCEEGVRRGMMFEYLFPSLFQLYYLQRLKLFYFRSIDISKTYK